MSKKSPEVAIIVPAYNEEASIGQTIEDYKNFFPEAVFVVVDNNSTDRTSEVAQRYLNPLTDFLLHETKQGKGAAVKSALSRVSSQIYIMTDADLTYPACDARKLFDTITEVRCDMVVGDRVSDGVYAKQNVRFGHSAGNKLLSWSFQSLLEKDSQTFYPDCELCQSLLLIT